MPHPQKTLTINAELVDRLNELAACLDRPREELVNRAIDQFLEVQAWQLETKVPKQTSPTSTP